MFDKRIYFMCILLLTDCFIVPLSFVVAFFLKFYIFTANISHYSFTNYFIYTLYFIPVWIMFIHFFIHYKLFYISFFELFIKILKVATLFIIVLFTLMFVIKFDFSRLCMFFLWINLIFFTLTFRYILRKIFVYIVFKLDMRWNILVIGKNVKKYKKVFNNYYINKVFYYPHLLDTNNIEKLKLLSIKKNIKEIIVIDYQIINDEFLFLCNWGQTNDIDIKIFPIEVQTIKDKIVLDETLGIPIILLTHNPIKKVDYFVKKVMDIVMAFILLVILSPVFVIIAILIKLDSKGPVFFKQIRVGYNQKNFSCYKFRSMRNNATKELDKLKTNKQIFFKMKDDPRVTKVGRFIRKYSLDELPQLFNVLKGEMSLVGPRPMLESETNVIEKKYHNYKKLFKVLPGISGLWQVSGRSILSDEKKIDLEIFYVDNWSLALDIKILLKTVFVVILRTGAY